MVFWWWCFWYGAIGAADGDGTVWFVRRRYGVAQWTEPSGRPDWMQHFRIRPWGPCRLSPLISKLAMAKVLSHSHIIKMVIFGLLLVLYGHQITGDPTKLTKKSGKSPRVF